MCWEIMNAVLFLTEGRLLECLASGSYAVFSPDRPSPVLNTHPAAVVYSLGSVLPVKVIFEMIMNVPTEHQQVHQGLVNS